MAKIKLNPVMEAMRGSIGDLVFRRFGEEVVVGRKPDPSVHPPTPGQQAVRERFRLAAPRDRRERWQRRSAPW